MTEDVLRYKNAEIRMIETSADLGLSVRAPTLGELFAGFGYGFTSLITDPSDLSLSKRKTLDLVADERSELIVYLIDTLILLFETEGFLAREFTVKDREKKLRALFQGDRFDPDKHPLYAHIKAATYHKLSLTGPRPWQGDVILDV